MRVLHVIPAIAARYGGPSAVLAPMCRALAEQGIEPLIVATNADGPGRLAVSTEEPTTWEGVPALFFDHDFSESFKYSHAMSRWLRAHIVDFDVVHIHGLLSHACLAAASACRRAGVPYIVRPLGTLAPWSLDQKAFRKRTLLALGGRRAIEHSAAVHCTSDEERHGIEQSFPGTTAVVVPLGVDPEFVSGVVAWSERDQNPYVLVVSRLHPKKNLEALINAFLAVAPQHDSSWRLVIAGSGEPEYLATLEHTLQTSSAHGKVILTGWIDGAPKREWIQGASIFALPSLHENFGVSLLEALAAGVPAIVSEHVNLAQDVRNAGAGWVVEPSVESLSRHLNVAMGSAAERQVRGRAARELSRRFGWPSVASQLVDLYQRIRTNGAVSSGAELSAPATVRH